MAECAESSYPKQKTKLEKLEQLEKETKEKIEQIALAKAFLVANPGYEALRELGI